MYEFQSYFYINRITNELRQFRNENEIPADYIDKVINVNLDVTYNASGYIDKKSANMVADIMVKEQLRAPPVAYIKVSFSENENDEDIMNDSRDSFDSDAAWNERAEPEGETVALVDEESEGDEEDAEEEEDVEYEEEEVSFEEESAEEDYDDSADDGVVVPDNQAIDDNLSLY